MSSPNTPEPIRFDKEIEPVVQLIENTPRDQCVPTLTKKLREGLTYRQFLTALTLATLRKGNAHHEMYVLHPTHEMSLNLPQNQQIIPLFWAMDAFKQQQNRFPAPPTNIIKHTISNNGQAHGLFKAAMEDWNQEQAEQAIFALVEYGNGPGGIQETLWQYGARDWGFIGHKMIATINGWRLLQVIGWQHAKWVLPFIIKQLLDGKRDQKSIDHYENNLNFIKKAALPIGWTAKSEDRNSTLQLLKIMYTGNVPRAIEAAQAFLYNSTCTAHPIWDAIHLSAGEFMLRFEKNNDVHRGSGLGSRPLHANTTANAFRYAFRHATHDATRLLMLLQAVGWVTEFIREEQERGYLRDKSIIDLETTSLPESADQALDEIFDLLPIRTYGQDLTEIPENRLILDTLTSKVLTFGQKFGVNLYQNRVRALTLQKSTPNAHDYKFPIAIFEDLPLINNTWQPYILATSIHGLHSHKAPNTDIFNQLNKHL